MKGSIEAMTRTRHDVVGIGNAIVDVLANTDEPFLVRHGLAKGTMTLIDAARAEQLYRLMGPAVECSGGSAANTMAGLASLGASCAYIGKVRDDLLGQVFRHDIRAAGVDFDTPAASQGPSTARCLVLITPDAQRTMQTFLGASATLDAEDVDAATVEGAGILYLEGYLWDPEPAKRAFLEAAKIAHRAGRKVALTLSDPFCVERHREEFQELLDRHVDIVLANENEARALYQTAELDMALERLGASCEVAAITRSQLGSVVLAGGETFHVEAEPVERVVDTTGAGDLYASGFLFGLSRGYDPVTCGRLGSVAAAEVIGHFGARPETSLKELVQRRLPLAPRT